MDWIEQNRTLLEDVVVFQGGRGNGAGGDLWVDKGEGSGMVVELEYDFPSPSGLNYTIEETVPEGNGTTTVERVHRWFTGFLEENDYLLWIAVAIGALLVLAIVAFISYWIYRHRQRIILERKRQREAERERHPSESNLESYKRPNMPPQASSKPPTLLRNGGFYSDEPEFTNLESAADVYSIRGVPNRDVRADQYRPLPQPRNGNNNGRY